MDTRRGTWSVSGALLLVAGLLAGWSTFLHWQPCRGAMLNGSIVRGYDYGPGFSDACLRRMDGGLPFPYPPEPTEQTAWASELGVAAMVLAGLAWLVLVPGTTWGVRTKVAAALPGLLTLGLAVNAGIAAGRPDRDPDAYLPTVVWLLVEILMVVAAIAILRREAATPTRSLLIWALVLWGSTAFGGVHMAAEYLAMGTFSDANWDNPPGTGYLTAALLTLAGGLTLAYALRRSGSPGPTEPVGRTLTGHPA